MTNSSVPGGLIACLLAAALAVAACGQGEEKVRVRGTPEPDHAKEVARNPYAVTCRDLARQTAHPESARLVIYAEFALAKDPVLRKHVAEQTLNRTGRSVYYGLTEVCKGREPFIEPARLAIKGVLEGKYLAARNRPG